MTRFCSDLTPTATFNKLLFVACRESGLWCLYECLARTNLMWDRVDIASAEAGQCVALALRRVKRTAVRKGMVIVHKSDTPPKGRDQCRSPQVRPNSLKLPFGLKDRCSFYSKPQHSWRRCEDDEYSQPQHYYATKLSSTYPVFRSDDESTDSNLSGDASLWSESSVIIFNLKQLTQWVAGCTTDCPDCIHGPPTGSATHRRSCDGTI